MHNLIISASYKLGHTEGRGEKKWCFLISLLEARRCVILEDCVGKQSWNNGNHTCQVRDNHAFFTHLACIPTLDPT